MSALEKAKSHGKEGVIAKIAECGLLEFGVDRTPVAAKWQRVNEERKFQSNPIRVVAALNNADVDGALLALLKENEERVFEGMSIAAIAVDADELFLHIPQKEAAYAEKIADKAAARGIQVKVGLVNCRESRGGAFHHIETMLALADIFDDCYEGATYMAVRRGGVTGPLERVAYGTKVAQLVGEADVKAVALGTRLYDSSALDMAITEDAQIGNGVITVYGAECCMIHEAEAVLSKEREQSCGKCTFCREGLYQLHTMTQEITQGQGKKEFTALMQEIGEAMRFSTPCTMGQTASDFTLGTLKHFAAEYEDHIRKKKCAANVCSAFQNIYIDPNLCKGCGACAEACPKSAIEGSAGYIHVIDEFACDKCGKCLGACENGAVVQTSGRVPKLPTRPTKVGRFKKR